MLLFVILRFVIVAVMKVLYRQNLFHYIKNMFRRDIRLLWFIILTRFKTNAVLKKKANVFKEFLEVAAKYPQKQAFLYVNQVWTFTDVRQFADKVANYFHYRGYKKGECIALFLENCPEYVCIWLGLSKVGIITALINTSLVKRSLVHCIKVANCKAIIFSSSLAQAIDDIRDEINNIPLYEYNSNRNIYTKYIPLKREIERAPENGSELYHNVVGDDILLYIFTSGTTGLPKAALITNDKYLTFLCGTHAVLPRISSLIIYSPMPLYHVSGSAGSVALTIIGGATTVLSKKFSASNYWKDCAKYRCNVAQYIGEMCRYILAAPYDSNLKHQVKYIIGNGLQRSIWEIYVKKFKIKNVIEFYGSSEGNVLLINLDNKVGSVGCIPAFLKNFIPIALVQYNELTGEIIRDQTGRCVQCKINESGIVIAKINPKIPNKDFKGYLNKDETNKKILMDVFEVGDRYFNSGDVLICDEFGYFYFVDRVGDTFRWKGENVSTNEVENIIIAATNLHDTCVYGVEIPGTEGKTGMVAIADNTGSLQLDTLAQLLKENLPAYAMPTFVRVVDSIPMTETFKTKKGKLQKEGYNIYIVKDKIYFLNSNTYVVLTPGIYNNIINKKLRL